MRIVLATGFADLEDPYQAAANDWVAKDLETYHELSARDPRWQLILKCGDIERILQTPDSLGILFHIEGANAIKDESGLAFIEKLYERGLRSIGIVWILSNPLGGGTNDPEKSLTPLGEKLIRWCEKNGVVVDLAHMNRPTFWKALEITKKPPFVSHTAAAALFETPRNLNDEQLRAVAKRDGIAGIFVSRSGFMTKGSSAAFTMSMVLDHVEHMAKVAGINHVAIGSDYGGILSGVPEDMKSVTDLPLLIKGLEKRGWSDADLEKLAYKNAQRVLSAHLTPQD